MKSNRDEHQNGITAIPASVAACRSIKEYCVSKQPVASPTYRNMYIWRVGLAKDLCRVVENEKCSYRCGDGCDTVLMFIPILISFLL